MFCSIFVSDYLADGRFKLCSVLFLLWTVWPTRGLCSVLILFGLFGRREEFCSVLLLLFCLFFGVDCLAEDRCVGA